MIKNEAQEKIKRLIENLGKDPVLPLK